MTTTPTPPQDAENLIAQYFAQRDAHRAKAVAELLSGLTERELLLVKEAAVMGWVQGVRHHDLKIPGDRAVLVTVVDACRSFSDLYPTITTRPQFDPTAQES